MGVAPQRGRCGRMGVMLLYLVPAMFCDVSDSWRLRPNQRVRVALAGVAVQGATGGTAAIASLLLPPSVGHAVLLYAIANYIAGAVNVLPFIKLDGYIAFMSHVDRPNLRRTSMQSIKHRLVGFLEGRRTDDGLPGWIPWFGLACVATPIVIAARAAGRWLQTLVSLGLFGSFIAASVLMLLATVAVKAAIAAVRQLRRSDSRPARMLGLTVAALAAVIGLGLVPVPTSETAAYRIDSAGTATLVVPEGSVPPDLRVGDKVTLNRNGFLGHTETGSATVTSVDAVPTEISLDAVMPVSDSGLLVKGKAYRLTLDRRPADNVGSVTVNERTIPMAAWAKSRLVDPALHPFSG